MKSFEKIVIAVHGFASDKESGMIRFLTCELEKQNIGVVAFDLSGHGTNPKPLTIANCLQDIEEAVQAVREQTNAPISFFSSSFGGYLTALYLNQAKEKFEHIIFRAPAITMRDALRGILKENFEKEIEFKGVALTNEFYRELHEIDLLAIAPSIKQEINIIYGTEDMVVSNDDIIEFATRQGSTLHAIEGADHRFKRDGDLAEILDVVMQVLD